MFVRSVFILSLLLASVPVGQAKPFASKVDLWAKRLLNRVTKNTILNSRQAIIGAVGIAAVSCGNIACEKIQQPVMDGFTRSGDPNVGFNVGYYDTWKGIGGSYHAYNVDNPEASGIIGGNVIIPINLHSRLASFGDFRLSIGGGRYPTNVYGVVDSSSGSFTIHDALVDGRAIGNGVHASDHTSLTINVDSATIIEAEIYVPQIDVANDSIGRTIKIKIIDSESGDLITYNASTNWEFSLSSQLVSYPSNFALPSYQDIADAWGGRSNFVSRLGEMGFATNRSLHDSLSTNVYTADNVGGRTRLLREGGEEVQGADYWEEHIFSGVIVRLTASGNTADLSLTAGDSNNDVSDLPIGGTVTLGSGLETRHWTLHLGELKLLSGGYYRSMALSAASKSDRQAFSFIDGHIQGASQYHIDVAQIGWQVEESLTASGLW